MIPTWIERRVVLVPPLEQYALLGAMVVATVGLVVGVRVLARALGSRDRPGSAGDPVAGRTEDGRPAWVRYHLGYYGIILLFLAFDMEMAFMYPWATVFQRLGLPALIDMGVFLTVLFLGILYGWREGALRRQ
jgi:NADH-quinone oxidoreductase subunit A